MMIQFSCGNCGRSFQVADSAAGKRAQCKQCGQVIQVPSAVEQEVDEYELVEPASSAPTRSNSAVSTAGAARKVALSGAAAPNQKARRTSLINQPAMTPEQRRARLMATDPARVATAFPGFGTSAPAEPNWRDRAPAAWQSPRLAVALIVLGFGGILLPMIHVHFKLLLLLGPFEFPAGILMVTAGILLFIFQGHKTLGAVIGVFLVGAVSFRMWAMNEGVSAITDPLSAQKDEEPKNPKFTQAEPARMNNPDGKPMYFHPPAPPPPSAPFGTPRSQSHFPNATRRDEADSVPATPDDRPLEAWSPDPALAPKLGAAAGVGQYTIRPPEGFVLKKPGVWEKSSPGYSMPAQITLVVRRRVNHPGRSTSGTRLSPAKSDPAVRNLAAMNGATLESGTILDIPFTHATASIPIGNTRRVTSLYSGYDGDNWIMIQLTFAGAPDGTPEEMEAAARSLDRAK